MMAKPQTNMADAIEAGSVTNDPPLQSNEQQSFLGSTVKSVLGQCAGIVDVANFVIQSCSGDDDDGANRQRGILGPLFESPMKCSRNPRRNQGGALEFPAEGQFNDDVSDLSAHTLEEMEQLAKMMAQQGTWGHPTNNGVQQPYPGQEIRPPPEKSHQFGRSAAWASGGIGTRSADVPMGITASDSSSTMEEILDHGRDRQRKDGIQLFRAQVEG